MVLLNSKRIGLILIIIGIIAAIVMIYTIITAFRLTGYLVYNRFGIAAVWLSITIAVLSMGKYFHKKNSTKGEK
ncbi:hypothetical protein [Ruminococcus bicirculans (ex Wegman et al. 2014)]|uniref:hypothetical protein n=1 Tax=Ruminococcus bicirculans (ex Wegman et al. 2014) TaxID=1160721 RepID=UPI00325AF4FD